MLVQSGLLDGRFPFVRVGSGDLPLVVLPGLVLDNDPPSRTGGRCAG